jgi:hypothetical protein
MEVQFMNPFNPKMGQTIKTDAASIVLDRGFIALYHIDGANAPTATTSYIIAAVTLADGATTTKLAAALAKEPECARVLTITGNAATAVGDVVITGKNLAGETITETIVSTGAATVTGTKAFSYITSIVFPARGGAGDTIAVGTADKFGIPYKLARNTVLAIYNNNTLTTVASMGTSTTDLCKNFIDPTQALNGSDVDVYLIV